VVDSLLVISLFAIYTDVHIISMGLCEPESVRQFKLRSCEISRCKSYRTSAVCRVDRHAALLLLTLGETSCPGRLALTVAHHSSRTVSEIAVVIGYRPVCGAFISVSCSFEPSRKQLAWRSVVIALAVNLSVARQPSKAA
jgi:hypothetical protein